MFTITDSAKDELKKILDNNSTESDDGLRLIINEPGSFALMLDKKQENDEIIEHEGTIVLLYQKDMTNILDEIILDCHTTEDCKMLVISK